MNETPAESRPLAEWPFKGIALPAWIRVEEFRPFGNVLGLARGAAYTAAFNRLSAEQIGAIFRFALRCSPDVPWERTVELITDDREYLADWLRDSLRTRYLSTRAQREGGS